MSWMHGVALELEPELEAAQAGAAAASPSASGRFQALLALARRDPLWVQGFSEAMVARYRHFAATPVLQRRKMAAFVLAALHESGLHHDLEALLAGAAGGAAAATASA
jgi:hypothetical protein